MTRGSGRWHRGGLLGLPAVVALTALLSTTPSASAAAQAARRAGATEVPTDIRLLEQTPWVAPTGTAIASVHVSHAPSGARVQAILHTRLTTRGGLRATFDGTRLGSNQLWQAPVPLGGFTPLADGSVDATLAVPFTDSPSDPTGRRAAVTGPGVFPLELRVLDAHDDNVLASLTTYVVRLPAAGSEVHPLDVAPVVTLDAAPSVRPDGSVRVSSSSRAMVDAAIRALGGPAADRVPGAPEVPAAVAATPELLESLATSPDPTDHTRLTDLAGVIGSRTVLTRPFVDIDLAAWAANPLLSDRFGDTIARGRGATTTWLHAPDQQTWAEVPAPGRPPLTSTAITMLRTQGIERVLLPAEDLAPLDTQRFSRTLAQPFHLVADQGALTAVQIDADLQHDLTAGTPALAANRVLADLALIALELPSLDRGVALVPPGSSADALQAMQLVSAALATPTAAAGSGALVRPVQLSDLFSLPVARSGGERATGGSDLTRELTPSTPAGLGDYPDSRARTSARVDDYRRMVGSGDPTLAQLSALVEISGARSLDAKGRRSYLDAVDARLASALTSVTMPPRQTITLTARTGVIPITIQSHLGTPATVILHLDGSERLLFPDGDVQEVQLTDGVTHLRVRVRTRTPGDATLRVRLTSPTGQLTIAESRFSIHSTAVSGVGLLISLTALAFLLLWWGRHWLKARREREARRVRPADLLPAPSARRAAARSPQTADVASTEPSAMPVAPDASSEREPRV